MLAASLCSPHAAAFLFPDVCSFPPAEFVKVTPRHPDVKLVDLRDLTRDRRAMGIPRGVGEGKSREHGQRLSARAETHRIGDIRSF